MEDAVMIAVIAPNWIAEYPSTRWVYSDNVKTIPSTDSPAVSRVRLPAATDREIGRAHV